MLSREQKLIALGRAYESEMGKASIEKCNCMIRYTDGPQMPAIKRGKAFFTPEGDEIVRPGSYELMHFNQIRRLMKANNEIYVGHVV